VLSTLCEHFFRLRRYSHLLFPLISSVLPPPSYAGVFLSENRKEADSFPVGGVAQGFFHPFAPEVLKEPMHSFAIVSSYPQDFFRPCRFPPQRTTPLPFPPAASFFLICLLRLFSPSPCCSSYDLVRTFPEASLDGHFFSRFFSRNSLRDFCVRRRFPLWSVTRRVSDHVFSYVPLF